MEDGIGTLLSDKAQNSSRAIILSRRLPSLIGDERYPNNTRCLGSRPDAAVTARDQEYAKRQDKRTTPDYVPSSHGRSEHSA
jgi:hypothetical protein